MNYNHPEFGVWYLTETPIKTIPYGALIKWFDQVTQFGFHLGRGEIARRDGVISAKSLDSDSGLPWKRKTCVLVQDGKAVVFSEAAMRSKFQVGLYTTRQDFIFDVSEMILQHGVIFPFGSLTVTANVFCIPLRPTRCMKETFGNESALS